MLSPIMLPAVAVAASVVMLLNLKKRTWPFVALAASGVELLMALGVLHLRLGTLLPLVLGGALAAAGVLVYLGSGSKPVVSASTAAVIVGALQVVTALHL